MPGKVVDMAVAAAFLGSHGGGHGIEIVREESPRDGATADHKDLTLGVETNQHPRSGSLPDFDRHQGLAVRHSRRHGADESLALGYCACQAGQFRR